MGGDKYFGMVVADELKQVADVRRVDVAWRARVDGLLALTVHGSHHAVALSSTQGLDEGPHEEPHRTVKSYENQVRSIHHEERAQA